MAKRTVELEDKVGPFGVKLKSDSEGAVSLIIFDNRPVTRASRLHVDVDSLLLVADLGATLLNMVDSLKAQQ